VVIITNLALTIWILVVLDFSQVCKNNWYKVVCVTC
jgi:hypothetical protein